MTWNIYFKSIGKQESYQKTLKVSNKITGLLSQDEVLESLWLLNF